MINFFDTGCFAPMLRIGTEILWGFHLDCFGGDQVDISNGNLFLEVREGYLIEKGKLTTPIKSATLIPGRGHVSLGLHPYASIGETLFRGSSIFRNEGGIGHDHQHV